MRRALLYTAFPVLFLLTFFLAASPALASPESVTSAVYGTAPVIEEKYVLLSEAQLPAPDDPGALRNVALAAEKLDGAIVWPGGVFSYNRTVGERTYERGFVLGPVVVRGRNGWRYGLDVGGGVCRMSTALHHAVLKAGLKVVERHSHSIPVEYAEPGTDAAVNWGVWDYRFQNTTPYPVKIRASVQNGVLTADLYQAVPLNTNVHVLLDGREASFQSERPFVLNGATYVPAEFVERSFGLTVECDRLSNTACLSSCSVQLSVPAAFTETSAFVPLRAVSEALGFAVAWRPGMAEVAKTEPQIYPTAGGK